MAYKINNCFIIIIFILSTLVFLNTCSLDNAEIVRAPAPEDLVIKRERERRERAGETADDGTFLGDMFKGLTGSGDKTGGGGIGVNTYIWRASLDTLSFMPLLSADPFGGVIITDWHTNSETSQEKFKIVAYILGTELRVAAIKVSVFKKIKVEDGDWVDIKNSQILQNKIEDSILTKARKYKIQSKK
jgi:hypothetical protein